jgi:hypothetical protein
MSVRDQLIIDGDDERSLLIRETKHGFLFDVYEDGVYSSTDLTTEQAALVVKWLRDRIEGTDEG